MAAGLCPNPLGELTMLSHVPLAGFKRHRATGKAKGDGKVGESEKGEKGEGRGVLPHPKQKSGCATVLTPR